MLALSKLLGNPKASNYFCMKPRKHWTPVWPWKKQLLFTQVLVLQLYARNQSLTDSMHLSKTRKPLKFKTQLTILYSILHCRQSYYEDNQRKHNTKWFKIQQSQPSVMAFWTCKLLFPETSAKDNWRKCKNKTVGWVFNSRVCMFIVLKCTVILHRAANNLLGLERTYMYVTILVGQNKNVAWRHYYYYYY